MTRPLKKTSISSVLSLGQLLQHNPQPTPALIEPGLLPSSGILFVGGEPKVGKSLLVANLALALASGCSRARFQVPQARRVLICQFELPTSQFAARLAPMRKPIGSVADSNLLIDTQAAGHLLSAPRGLDHFLGAIRSAKADVVVLDPLYSTHDQDENDTRAMAALCQTLLRLRDASRAALIVVHHVRKSVGRYEIGSAFRGSSALHAVGDSYLLLVRPSPQIPTVELRFQFRYAPAQEPRLLTLDAGTLWFEASTTNPAPVHARRKVETADVQRALEASGIVTEDGTESFNVFEHNFAMRSEGSGDFAPRSGYSGAGPDPGGEGGGFWFRGPNNYIRNNVAANADVYGFQLAAGSLDSIRIPAFKGADMATDRETLPIDMTNAKVPEFANNEAYGAIQTGVAFGWNGEIKNFRAWNPSTHGLTATPTDKLTVDAVTVRGDRSVLADAEERPAGVWVGDYLAKSIAIRNADIQGMRTGVASPFFHSESRAEPGRGDGSVAIENSYFRNYFGIVVATTYQPKAARRRPAKTAVVRSSVFEPLNVPANPRTPPAAISMNYNMAPDDPEPRVPILVYDFNKKPGDNFKVYYSLQAPRNVAPCNDSRPALDGWVCN